MMGDPAKASSPLELETLDFNQFLHGDNAAQGDFSKTLVSSLQQSGVVKLSIQYFPHIQMLKLFDVAKSFFSLGIQSKLVAAHPLQPSPHRGYSVVGQERLSGITGFLEGLGSDGELEDLKETFDLGSPGDSKFPNRWPIDEHIPLFRDVVEQHYQALEHLHMQVLSALALGLGLEREFFTPLHERSHHEMRLLHYPPTNIKSLLNGKTRIADHTDFGSITLLFQDRTGGLQGRERTTGNYRALESEPSECLVMAGDCFQRWTGDLIWALRHRVTVPNQIQADDHDCCIPERFSIAFFGKPNRDVGVGNLDHPQFQGVKYPSVTAGDYNNMKLHRTY